MEPTFDDNVARLAAQQRSAATLAARQRELQRQFFSRKLDQGLQGVDASVISGTMGMDRADQINEMRDGADRTARSRTVVDRADIVELRVRKTSPPRSRVVHSRWIVRTRGRGLRESTNTTISEPASDRADTIEGLRAGND